MVVIRLALRGRKGSPVYSVVVADKRSPRDGRFIEKIGFLIPSGTDRGFELSRERYEHWVQHGAQPTARVAALYRHVMAAHSKADGA